METYEIYPVGTIISYKLGEDPMTGDIIRQGNIVTFDENMGRYHVGDRLGKSWSRFGFYWVHPRDVREVIKEENNA